MIAFVIIGCFQLNASKSQEKDNSFRVPVNICARYPVLKNMKSKSLKP
jgi:hypothetical protein